MTWAEDVPCPLCGAAAREVCTMAGGLVAKQPHRARILQSIVGEKSGAAVSVVDKILRDNETSPLNNSNKPAYTLPTPPKKAP